MSYGPHLASLMGSRVPTLWELIWLSVSNIVMPTQMRYTGGKIKHACDHHLFSLSNTHFFCHAQ